MEVEVTIKMAALPAVKLAALKRALLLAFRAPWDLVREEADLVAGLSPAAIAEIVVEELVGGKAEGVEALGLKAFIAGALQQNVAVLGRDAWAMVLGQTRQKLMAAEQEISRLRSMLESPSP